MSKFFERLLQTIADFLAALAKEMGDFVKHRRGSEKPTSTTDPGQDKLSTEMLPLAVEPPVIQVKCISCGELVGLTGICQKCQGAICSTCREYVHHEELDMWVIQCRNCAVTAQA
jgi:hypothetical protein